LKKYRYLCLGLIILTIFAGCAGCAACSSNKADLEKQRLEAERLAAEEAARLEAERLAAEEAARLEAERLAAEEAARLEAERLAAEAAERARLAELERQRQAGQTDAERERLERLRQEELERERARLAELERQRQAQAATRRPSVAPADTAHPMFGTWVNSNETIVMDFHRDGTVAVTKYQLIDEYVEVYWRQNRNVTGGGFYDTRNPVDYESVYTGTGTYTVDRNNIEIKLSLTNDKGEGKAVSCAGTFNFLDAQQTNFRMSKGLARKFIIREDNRTQIDTKEFVFQFYRVK
jgi:hypothetical protein